MRQKRLAANSKASLQAVCRAFVFTSAVGIGIFRSSATPTRLIDDQPDPGGAKP